MYSTYPMRTSKDKYKIPLARRHMCSVNCSLCIYEDENGVLQIQPNPQFVNGRCEYSETYEWTVANIADPVNWSGIERLNEVVIPDSSFSFTISFPLQNPRTITVKSQTSSGFTRKDILTIIQAFYSETYNTESATATQNTIEITTICGNCITATIDDNISSIELSDKQTCSVCLEELQGPCSRLICGHNYHYTCIRGWTDTGNTTCPLCRSQIIDCSVCHGMKTVSETYTAAVPERESVPFGGRVLTDGQYGIYNYYLEDLALSNIIYNRRERKLSVEVCPVYDMVL